MVSPKRKSIPRRRRGPPRDSEKWAEVEWIEQRAEELRAAGNDYDPIAKASLEYWWRKFWPGRKAPPKNKQTDKQIERFRKHIKNARDEWRKTERLIKAARQAQRSKRSQAAD